MIALTPGVCPLCPTGTPTRTVGKGRDFEYSTVPDEFTVVSCTGCGVWFLDPRPADDAIGGLYPPEYEPYHVAELPRAVRRAYAFVQRRKVNAIRQWADDGATILDMGCGGGSLLRLMRSHGPVTWTLLGWDLPGPHLEQLRVAGFDVIGAPIDREHTPEVPVDVVILNQVIEHVADPAKLVAVVSHCLRPGGVLIVETPNTGGLDARIFRRRYWGGYHFPRHLVLFNAGTLEMLLTRGGYDVVSKQPLVSSIFWNQSVHHWLSERRLLSPLARLFVARNPVPLAAATVVDLVLGRFIQTSNIRVVARRRADRQVPDR